MEAFDLGLTEDDYRAMREARSRRPQVDRETALKLMLDCGPQVAAAVRRRPLFTGAPFRLPGHKEGPGS